jgi:hypothetical protein
VHEALTFRRIFSMGRSSNIDAREAILDLRQLVFADCELYI